MIKKILKSVVKINRGQSINMLRQANFAQGERYTNYTSPLADNLPQDHHYQTQTLERNEIETRILKILSNFQQINLNQFKFDQNLKDLNLDSLDRISVLTSIEEEFHTVFEDNVFENFQNLEQVVRFLQSDHNIY